MPQIEIDLKPVKHITIDSIGKPGQRVFYIQGMTDEQTVTLLVEKVQVQTMALGVEEFLSEVTNRYPNLSASSADFVEENMRIRGPVDPLFRVGDLGLAYDTEEDLLILVARELVVDAEETEESGVVRYWCTRSQIRALARWGLDVASRGRPICPYCGEPMEPEGHFCPKKNGHKN